jgi:pyruvate/2-oxoglutarate dehydrogenase complex dihydrolipoamide acyltransferase (E2) component
MVLRRLKWRVNYWEILPRENMNISISFDHDLDDGAPVTRFMNTFVELLENCYQWDDLV